jgi:hypothetical protein
MCYCDSYIQIIQSVVCLFLYSELYVRVSVVEIAALCSYTRWYGWCSARTVGLNVCSLPLLKHSSHGFKCLCISFNRCTQYRGWLRRYATG